MNKGKRPRNNSNNSNSSNNWSITDITSTLAGGMPVRNQAAFKNGMRSYLNSVPSTSKRHKAMMRYLDSPDMHKVMHLRDTLEEIAKHMNEKGLARMSTLSKLHRNVAKKTPNPMPLPHTFDTSATRQKTRAMTKAERLQCGVRPRDWWRDGLPKVLERIPAAKYGRFTRGQLLAGITKMIEKQASTGERYFDPWFVIINLKAAKWGMLLKNRSSIVAAELQDFIEWMEPGNTETKRLSYQSMIDQISKYGKSTIFTIAFVMRALPK